MPLSSIFKTMPRKKRRGGHISHLETTGGRKEGRTLGLPHHVVREKEGEKKKGKRKGRKLPRGEERNKIRKNSSFLTPLLNVQGEEEKP